MPRALLCDISNRRQRVKKGLQLKISTGSTDNLIECRETWRHRIRLLDSNDEYRTIYTSGMSLSTSLAGDKIRLFYGGLQVIINLSTLSLHPPCHSCVTHTHACEHPASGLCAAIAGWSQASIGIWFITFGVTTSIRQSPRRRGFNHGKLLLFLFNTPCYARSDEPDPDAGL